MISLEQYASVYLAMVSAMANPQQQDALCEGRGFSAADWRSAQTFYTAKMATPADMGRTAMAFAQLLAAPKTTAQAPKSGDFTAQDVKLEVSEYGVQMVTFRGVGRHLVFQRGLDFDPTAEAFNGNTFHMEFDGQGKGLYGGLQRATLARDRLTLVFDAEGRKRTECAQLTVLFAIEEKKWAYLARKLRFVLSPVLEVAPFTPSKQVQVGKDVLHQERVSAEVGAMKVRIRPNLANLKATGRYKTMVNLTLQSETLASGADPQEAELFSAAESALVDEFEHDLAAVFAFDVTDRDGRKFFLYSSLGQQEFMKRLNAALRGLPRLPLGVTGGEDEPWENYAACLADVQGEA